MCTWSEIGRPHATVWRTNYTIGSSDFQVIFKTVTLQEKGRKSGKDASKIEGE